MQSLYELDNEYQCETTIQGQSISIILVCLYVGCETGVWPIYLVKVIPDLWASSLRQKLRQETVTKTFIQFGRSHFIDVFDRMTSLRVNEAVLGIFRFGWLINSALRRVAFMYLYHNPPRFKVQTKPMREAKNIRDFSAITLGSTRRRLLFDIQRDISTARYAISPAQLV